jgi:hypothetical protein
MKGQSKKNWFTAAPESEVLRMEGENLRSEIRINILRVVEKWVSVAHHDWIELEDRYHA